MIRHIFIVMATAALAIWCGAAQAGVTRINFSGIADPLNFTFNDATFTGGPSSVFFAGVPDLYVSFPNAWVAAPGEMLEITFASPVTELSFFATALDIGAFDVFGADGAFIAENVAIPDGDIKTAGHFFSFVGDIGGLRLRNTSELPNIGNFGVYGLSIDNLTFVPEPAGFALVALGLAGLGLARRRRAA